MLDYVEFTNRAINRVLDTKVAVVSWAHVFNTHRVYHGTFKTKIEFSKYEMLTVRDYAYASGISYLADVTCKPPQQKQACNMRRKFGIAQHTDYAIPDLHYDVIKMMLK